MKNKKMLVVLGVIVLVLVATAAYVGGQFLNQQGENPTANIFSPAGGSSGSFSAAIKVKPAPELPTTNPVLSGPFVSRKDNTLVVQQISMEMGGGGGVVISGSTGNSSDTGAVIPNTAQGPKVEVVINSKTKIYQDVTQINITPGKESEDVQQEVKLGSLEDLAMGTMVTVWGRTVGDRVIADIILYSNPVMFKQ